MALVMTLPMTPADDPAPSERDCMGVRNAHTGSVRNCAHLCPQLAQPIGLFP